MTTLLKFIFSNVIGYIRTSKGGRTFWNGKVDPMKLFNRIYFEGEATVVVNNSFLFGYSTHMIQILVIHTVSSCTTMTQMIEASQLK